MSAHFDRNARPGVKTAPLRFHMECSFAAVRHCAARVRGYLAGHGVAEKDLWACELAFVEGCNNAVQHTPASKAGEKLIVELSCESTHVELRINDHTQGFDLPAESRLPAPEEERGRGIYLMRTLMDEVSYIRDPSANCLVLKKARTGI
jgi:anti-sigma regulatory factor (Ser/Thr protein kinase)